MIVLSHRGYWLRQDERNTEVAFRRSFDLGFGTETDLRDRHGELVVSHDPPGADAVAVDALLRTLDGRRLPLALNIKADGLARQVASWLEGRTELSDAFVFDMSVPDLVQYAKMGIPFFTRMSELEPSPALIDQAAGIWLDSFQSTWFDLKDIRALLESGLRVCVVSSELHGRDPQPLWRMLMEDAAMCRSERLMICTDRPEEMQALMENGT